MASILRKAAKYKRVSTVLQEGEAHLKDPFFTPPQILKPPAPRTPTPDDITDFPQYKTIPIPETVPYMEGKYRPPSIPFVTGTHSSLSRLVPLQLLPSTREGLQLVCLRSLPQ